MTKTQEILIIEDNEDNSLLEEKILNYFGFKTTIVSRGIEALHYCKTHVPDLILIDLSLPDIDGVEIGKLLRKKKEFQHIPLIAITASAKEGMQEITKEAGFNDFISKPFKPNDLISIIQAHLS